MARLRPGVSVFGVPGRGSALRDPAGRLVGVDLPAPSVATLTRWFDGPDAPAPDGLDDEIAAFAAAGYLDRPTAPRSVTVQVAGVGALADAVAAALTGPSTTTVVRRPLPDVGLGGLDGLDGVDAVCAVADGPAPAAWSTGDGLPARGVAWFRLAVEGRHGILEPPAVQPGDPGHGDVRARRLAAAGSGHRHLAAYWDSAPTTPTTVGDRALLAALLAAEVRAWVGGHDIGAPGDLVPAALPARRRLRVVDLDTAAIADHPLLPVPPTAP